MTSKSPVCEPGGPRGALNSAREGIRASWPGRKKEMVLNKCLALTIPSKTSFLITSLVGHA